MTDAVAPLDQPVTEGSSRSPADCHHPSKARPDVWTTSAVAGPAPAGVDGWRSTLRGRCRRDRRASRRGGDRTDATRDRVRPGTGIRRPAGATIAMANGPTLRIGRIIAFRDPRSVDQPDARRMGGAQARRPRPAGRPRRCRPEARGGTAVVGVGRAHRSRRGHRPGRNRTPVRFGSSAVDCARALRPARSCAARASTTSRTSPSPSRATGSSSSPGSPAPGRAASPSTRSTPRASAATSRASRRTPASSSARWRSRTSTRSTASRRRSRSTRRARSRNPRSTVGTVTEIYDYLRLLFARIGHPALPDVRPRDRAPDASSRSSTRSSRCRRARGSSSSGRSSRTARPRATASSRPPASRASSASASTARCRPRRDAPTLDKYKRHTIEVVVDRFVVRHAEAPEAPSAPTAGRSTRRPASRPDPDAAARRLDRDRAPPRRGRRRHRAGRRATGEPPDFEERRYSERYSCPYDGTTIDELEPRSFSFNSPHGACPTCTGLGTQLEIDPTCVIPDRSKSLGRRRARAVGRAMPTEASWRLQDPRGDLRRPRLGLSARRSATCPAEAVEYLLYAARDEQVVVALPPRARREHVQRDVRGARHEPRAPLPRDRVGLHQGRDREVHGRPALPGLRRAAAAARGRSRSPSTAGASGTSRRCSVTDALAWVDRAARAA